MISPMVSMSAQMHRMLYIAHANDKAVAMQGAHEASQKERRRGSHIRLNNSIRKPAKGTFVQPNQMYSNVRSIILLTCEGRAVIMPHCSCQKATKLKVITKRLV